MIKIDCLEIAGLRPALHGMRNPMNSWDKSDSCFCPDEPLCEGNCEASIGAKDKALAMKLAANGPVHAKYRRMILVWADINAPLYWWKEFDTYRMGVEKNSCSTMHKIQSKRFEREDFSVEHLENCAYPKEGLNLNGEAHWFVTMDNIISSMNVARQLFLDTGDKKYWWQMIQLLPSSYNQRRTVMMSYEALTNMYEYRHDHKLDEWRAFCTWVEGLPSSELITGAKADE